MGIFIGIPATWRHRLLYIQADRDPQLGQFLSFWRGTIEFNKFDFKRICIWAMVGPVIAASSGKLGSIS